MRGHPALALCVVLGSLSHAAFTASMSPDVLSGGDTTVFDASRNAFSLRARNLAIVFFLMRRRTRAAAYAAVVIFHALTAVLFPIGMFPWIMIVATLVFFPADWPVRWWPAPVASAPAAHQGPGDVSRWTLGALTVYAALQLLVPLRAYWPGADPEWTGRGFNFGWRVMLVQKSGHVEFTAYRPATGERLRLRTRDYVTGRQEEMLAQDPDMIRALALHAASDLRASRPGDVEVRAEAFASLNGGAAQRLIDPRADLAGPLTPGWILPRDRSEPLLEEAAHGPAGVNPPDRFRQ